MSPSQPLEIPRRRPSSTTTSSPTATASHGAAASLAPTGGATGDATLDEGGAVEVAPGGAMNPSEAQPTQQEGVGAAASCPDPDETPATVGADRYQAAIACLINAVRSDRGLPPLRTNATLARAGATYAQAMVSGGFFAHVGRDGSTVSQRDQRAGYPLGGGRTWAIGETLAWGTGALETARAVVNAWMHSTGHRRILLRARWQDVGVGSAAGNPTDAKQGTTIAAEFGVTRS